MASWPDEVQFVSFNDHEEAIWRGKGYGEMGIIQYVLTNVQLVKSADLVMKVTGRYHVANVGPLVGGLTSDPLIEVSW